MNKIYIEVSNCCDCPHSYTEQIYTADPWEHEMGVYCSNIVDEESYNRKHKLVCADDWDIRASADIPDWCPCLNHKEV